ncbi:hypothetical protein ACLB2K_062714 [Fragaria x ananassa]
MVEFAVREIVFHKDCDTPQDKDVPNLNPHKSLQLSSAEAVTYAKWSVRIEHVSRDGWFAQVKQCPCVEALLDLTSSIDIVKLRRTTVSLYPVRKANLKNTTVELVLSPSSVA